jgi:hypothetical protein
MIKQCVICNLDFSTTGTRKTCSDKCFKKHLSNQVAGKAGGYRAGSGRAKSGYYKGIYCGSTYELAWVIYKLDHNLPFTRFEGYIEYNNKKYFPDFLVDNTIIEIKGWTTPATLAVIAQKNLAANNQGYKVEVLFKENLSVEFAWVKSKYNYAKMQELYDDYSPMYSYLCTHCGITFSKDKKIKSEYGFCSRVCAGKGHKGAGNPAGFNKVKLR